MRKWKRCTALILAAVMLLSLMSNGLAVTASAKSASDDDSVTVTATVTDAESTAEDTDETSGAAETGETSDAEDADEADSEANDADAENQTGSDETDEDPAADLDIAISTYKYILDGTDVLTEADLLAKGAKDSENVVSEEVNTTAVKAVTSMLLSSAVSGEVSLTADSGGSTGGAVNTINASTWTFENYYLNETDSYNVSETDDFTLKYQFAYTTDEDRAAQTVEIRIPAALYTDRDGNLKFPDDIGVPEGTPSDYTYSLSTPFNYYLDTTTNELVFWNYRTIVSGSRSTVQVLYSDIDIMDVVDGTTWSITPTISVTHESGTVETEDGDTMTGSVNTGVSLGSLNKYAYNSSDTSYTPGLYSETQVMDYINLTELPAQFAGDNFDDYIYTVWAITIGGTATQQWSLLLEDSPTATAADGSTVSGYVVGYSWYAMDTTLSEYEKLYGVTYNSDGTVTVDGCTDRDISISVYVVTAFLKTEIGYDESATDNSIAISNTATVTVHPDDGLDADQEKERTANYTWVDYEWNYPDQYIGVSKEPDNGSDDSKYTAWLDIYRNNREAGTDTTGITYSLLSLCYGGIFTHNVTNAASTLGWKELIAMDSTAYGDPLWSDTLTPYYEVTTVDDALYLYPEGDQTNYVILDEEDYYYTAVTVTQTDVGYDIFEDSVSDEIEQCLNAYADGTLVIDQGITIYAMYANPDESWIDHSLDYTIAGETDDVTVTGTGSSTWTYVGHVSWDDSGVMTYTFTDAQIAMEPYRVMVVHDTVNYLTYCDIDVEVALRADSPVLAQYVTEDTSYIQLENMAGVAGELFRYVRDSASDEWEPGLWNNGTLKHAWFHDYDNSWDPDGNYTEPGIADYTLDLYGMYLQRDGGWAELTSLTPHAESYKTGTIENDADNKRVLINYILTAFEGYEIANQDTLDQLLAQGFDMEIRDEVVFYDLLPYGVNINLSAGVTAGQLYYLGTTLGGSNYTTSTSMWDKRNVTVTVTEDDIITNWNGTGRTMVAFHLKYTGTDPRELYGGLWFQGYGIQFQAYYEWESIETVETEYNIAAYMPETGDTTPLHGQKADVTTGNLSENLVYMDDGTVPKVVTDDYSPFSCGDINGDGITDIYNVLYAKSINAADVSTSTSSVIQKLVKADSDTLAAFSKTTSVGLKDTYTYQITLNNTGGTMTDIVIFDILETAWETRKGMDYEDVYGVLDDPNEPDGYWQGTFLSLSMNTLDSLGISYTIYYNASSDAVISEGASDGTGVITTPGEVLTEANGWYTAARWEELGYTPSQVKALAVDLGNYELAADEFVTFEVHMQAPADMQTANYAFNNVSYYTCTTDDTGVVTQGTTPSNSTRVELSETGNLVVQKEFDDVDSVPAALQSTSFTFTLTKTEKTYTQQLDGNGTPVRDSYGNPVYDETETSVAFANQIYTLYTYDTDTGTWVASSMIRSTDLNGQLTLTAGQKAVFSDVAGYADVVVTEAESALWDSSVETTESTETVNGEAVKTITCTYTNTYRSPVYLYKTTKMTEYADTDDATKIANATFTFLVEVWDDTVEVTTTDGTGQTVTSYGAYVPYVDETVCYVDKVVTDGSSQTILSTTTTDANGYLTVDIDDIAVIYPGEVGTAYRITEVNLDTDLWICTQATVTGTAAVYGTSSTITNIYKKRALILTKTLEGYDGNPADVDATWTFKLSRIAGIDDVTQEEKLEPFNGNWYMTDSSGNKLTGTGTSGNIVDGVFSFTGAGADRRVVIEGLTAGEQYRLEELTISYTDANGATQTFNFADKEANGSEDYVPDGFLYDFGADEEVEITMPLYVSSVSTGVANMYLPRDLSVSKLVVTSEGSTSYADVEFTFTLEKYIGSGDADDAANSTDPADWEPVTDQPYLLNGNADDGNGTAYKTDASGQFTLKSGDTAYFDDIGFEGDIYRVTETDDPDYPVVYPADGSEILQLQEDAESVQFINGSPGLVMIEKNIVGLDSVGEAFVKLVEANNDSLTIAKEDDASSSETDGSSGTEADVAEAYAVTVKITVTDDQGNLVTDGDYTLYYIDDEGNFVQTFSFSGSITSDLKPGDRLVIKGVPEGYTVTAKETDEWERKLLALSAYAAGEISATAVLSEWDVETGEAKVSGSDVGIVTLTNNISTANEESEIFKIMSDNSTEVATGSVITFRVQVYNEADGTWSPASGIRYITMDDSGATSGVLTTGSDGLITLTKTDNGYPYIRFTDDVVKTNIYTGMTDGTLRIIEEMSPSDSEWGWLWGYGANRLTDVGEDTFINANDDDYSFEVAKVMTDGAAGASFTFQIEHVISASENPITEASQILESEAGAGLAYTVYDISTGKEVGTGTTDSKGQFVLEAGQYAVFNVPTGTVWLIRELVTAGALLDKVEVNSDSNVEVSILKDEDTAIIQEAYDNSYELSNEKMTAAIGSKTTVTKVIIGKLADYANEVDGVSGTNVGMNEDDLVYLYKVGMVVYILADNQKVRLQEDCEKMFNTYTRLTEVVFDSVVTSYVTNADMMFSGCSKLETLDLSGWDTGNITNMDWMFNSCTSLKTLNLSGWDTSSVTSMERVFYNCSSLTELDLSSWDVGNVTTMYWMFYGCSAMVSLDLHGWDAGNVTDMQRMFYNCKKLETLDVSGWNTGNVTTMYQMFYNCSSLGSLNVSSWNTGNVTTMEYMFYNCSSLGSLDVSGWNTGNVTAMYHMFYSCRSLESLDVSGWNTGNVTNMEGMFYNCSSLGSLEMGSWNTGNVTTMRDMFYGCSSLGSLNVSGWNTGNVTTMRDMFYGCSSLGSLNVSSWNTGNVTTMYRMFYGCSSLGSLDASGWSTGNVTTMYQMFYGCSSLGSLDVSGWNTGNVTTMEYMFYGCSSLKTLDVSGWNLGNVTAMSGTQGMFQDCTLLETIYADDTADWSSTTSSDGFMMFEGCENLVGGNGTAYKENYTGIVMARIDGLDGRTGYFTKVSEKPTE